MEKITGKIERVSNKGDKYGMKISNTWYNGFNDCPANEGDEVEVEFKINGDFRNPTKVTVLKKTAEPTKPERESTKPASMLTSYAKDLVVSLVASNKSDAVIIPDVMDIATDAVIKSYLKVKEAI